MDAVAKRQLLRIATATLVLSLVALFIALPAVSRLSPDAWTVYELAGTIGRDFFHSNTAREYATGSAYSSAFAPLWPLIVALFTRLTGNIYGSYVASFFSYAAFAAMAERFGRRAFKRRLIGLLSALLMLRFLGLREELGSGRSIPLYLFELALLGVLLIGLDSAPRTRSAMVGLLAGAMVMTRFDALPGALALIAGAPFIGLSRDRLALLIGCFVLALSPWIAYSLLHFHTAFVTDNRTVVLALDPRAFVYDYHSSPPLTLFDAPFLWAAKVVRHIPSIGKAFVLSAMESVFLPILVVLSVATQLHREGRTSGLRLIGGATRSLSATPSFLFLLVTIAPVAGYVMTGYWDHRYFSASIWLAELVLLAHIARAPQRAVRVAMLALVLAGGALNIAVLRYAVRENPLVAVGRELDRSPADTLAACLRRAGGVPENGVVYAGHDTVSRFKFGALTGWRVLPLPSNWERLGRREQNEFLRRYKASYIVDSRPAPEHPIGEHETPLDCAFPLRKLASATQ